MIVFTELFLTFTPIIDKESFVKHISQLVSKNSFIFHLHISHK